MYTYHGDASDRAYRNYAYSESGVTSLRNNTKAASKSLSHYSPPVSRRMTHSFNTYSNPTSRYPSSYYENASSWRNTFPRQDSYSRSESLNRYESRGRSNSFNRYDSYGLNRHESLSRIDALKRQDSLPQVKAAVCPKFMWRFVCFWPFTGLSNNPQLPANVRFPKPVLVVVLNTKKTQPQFSVYLFHSQSNCRNT